MKGRTAYVFVLCYCTMVKFVDVKNVQKRMKTLEKNVKNVTLIEKYKRTHNKNRYQQYDAKCIRLTCLQGPKIFKKCNNLCKCKQHKKLMHLALLFRGVLVVIYQSVFICYLFSTFYFF